MNPHTATLALGALAQEHRRELVKMLVQRGPSGLTASAMAANLGISPSALSFHLKELARAGLVRFRQDGRFRRYAAELSAMRELLEFLAEDCCAGHREISGVLAQGAHQARQRGPDADRERTMSERIFNVLFLCTGNSARSIIAECILNRWGARHFKAYSAGSHPRGEIHPYALDILRHENYVVDGLRSKSWEEFSGPNAPELDFVFTVCDHAASEVCPVWPGQPMTAHWGIPDPAAVEGREAEKRLAFADTMRMLTQRISIFVNLPIESLDKLTLQKRLEAIGEAAPRQSETA